MGSKKDGVHFPSLKIPIVGLAYAITTHARGWMPSYLLHVRAQKMPAAVLRTDFTSDYLKF